MADLTILRSGMQTTVQDRGRSGHRSSGVPVCGAMDLGAHGLANLLVGNPQTAATLEMTLRGDDILVNADTEIALTGGEIQAEVCDARGVVRTLPMNRPVAVGRESVLRLLTISHGCRTYMAFAGGIDVPEILGSRSTDLRSGFGGLSGRSLRVGDQLQLGTVEVRPQLRCQTQAFPTWFVRLQDCRREPVVTLRSMIGPHFHQLTGEAQHHFWTTSFTVSAESNRMGYRLKGPPLEYAGSPTVVSQGVCPGTIQLPPGSQPILLMADCAPTGGYPRILNVITADLSRAAQVRPGQQIQFRLVTADEARDELLCQNRALCRAAVMVELLRTGLRSCRELT